MYKNGIHYNKLSYTDKISFILDNHLNKSQKNFSEILFLSVKNENILIEEIYEITKFLLKNTSLDTENQNVNSKKLELIRENFSPPVLNYLLSNFRSR